MALVTMKAFCSAASHAFMSNVKRNTPANALHPLWQILKSGEAKKSSSGRQRRVALGKLKQAQVPPILGSNEIACVETRLENNN